MTTFAQTDEQRMLAETLDSALAGGSDWSAAIEQTGVAALGSTEASGGLGTDIRDAAVVAAAIGRANAMLPWAEFWVANRTRGIDDPALAEDATTLLHCAETIGLCRVMLHDAARFAKERRQFGVAIATFQALRHRMADMAMLLEQAQAIADAVIGDFDRIPATARARAVSGARILCADAARVVGEGAVQVHGAMGLTAELRVGGYFRRARELMQQDCGTAWHLRRYAA